MALQNTHHSLRTAAFSSVQLLFLPAAIFFAMYAWTLVMVSSLSFSTASTG